MVRPAPQASTHFARGESRLSLFSPVSFVLAGVAEPEPGAAEASDRPGQTPEHLAITVQDRAVQRCGRKPPYGFPELLHGLRQPARPPPRRRWGTQAPPFPAARTPEDGPPFPPPPAPGPSRPLPPPSRAPGPAPGRGGNPSSVRLPRRSGPSRRPPADSPSPPQPP